MHSDPGEKAKAETRDWLNSVPHTGKNIEDEGREQGLEDTNLEERDH